MRNKKLSQIGKHLLEGIEIAKLDPTIKFKIYICVKFFNLIINIISTLFETFKKFGINLNIFCS